MRRIGARRLALTLLAAACAISASIAVATAATRRSPRHPSHHACHPRRHHRCPKRHGKKPSATSKPTTVTAPASGGGTSSTGPTGTGSPSTPSAPGAAPPASSGEAPSGETPSTPAPAHVEVTAEDSAAFRFVLSRPRVPAGKVVIEFINHGQDEHNMHVVEGTNGGESGGIPNTEPGAHPSISLNLRHGSYTFFCSLPGHEAAGMKATLEVE